MPVRCLGERFKSGEDTANFRKIFAKECLAELLLVYEVFSWQDVKSFNFKLA